MFLFRFFNIWFHEKIVAWIGLIIILFKIWSWKIISWCKYNSNIRVTLIYVCVIYHIKHLIMISNKWLLYCFLPHNFIFHTHLSFNISFESYSQLFCLVQCHLLPTKANFFLIWCYLLVVRTNLLLWLISIKGTFIILTHFRKFSCLYYFVMIIHLILNFIVTSLTK